MKKEIRKFSLSSLVLFSLLLGAQTVAAQLVTVSNKSAKALKDYTVEVSLSKFPLKAGSYIAVSTENEIVPLEISTDLKGNQTAIS